MVKCRAVPQQAVWVVIFAVYDAGWEFLLYVLDDVDVDVVAGGSKVLLDLVVEEGGKGGVVCRRWWKVVTLVPALRATGWSWGKRCFSRRTAGAADRVAIPTVERRRVLGIGVGNVRSVGVGRCNVVDGPASIDDEHCANCAAPAVLVGVCGTPLWWMGGGMGWFGHGVC